MHVLILHEEVRADGRADELDVFAQAEAIEAALNASGHTASRCGFGLDMQAARTAIMQRSPDIVFNLVEAVAGQGRLIHLAPALLDALGVPYTGAPTEAAFLTSHKLLAKRMLHAASLPTPAWCSFGEADRCDDLVGRRCIVKSVWEHASVGLEDDALFDAQDANHVLDRVRSRAPALGGEAFAEAYIDGREFNLAILAGAEGPEVLPPAEIYFVDYPPDRPRLVGYRAKWDVASFEYHHTPRCFAFPTQDAALLTRLKELALNCWRLFGLRGYARVDFRVDNGGQPWILEINTNPCLSPDAGFPAAAAQAGLTMRDVVDRIVADGLRRRAGTRASGDACGSAGAQLRAAAGTPEGRRDVRFRETVLADDVRHVREITLSTAFFAAHEIDIAVELVQERLARGAASGYEFLFADAPGRTLGYACWGPIACTVGSYDLYWIAVHADARGQGLGRRLLEAVEQRIRAAGGRRIYVETSSRAQYEPTRRFYEHCAYRAEACLEHFYAPGDGKVVYVKALDEGA